MAYELSPDQVPALQSQRLQTALANIASNAFRRRLRRRLWPSRFGRGCSWHSARCSIGIDNRRDLSPSPPLNSSSNSVAGEGIRAVQGLHAIVLFGLCCARVRFESKRSFGLEAAGSALGENRDAELAVLPDVEFEWLAPCLRVRALLVLGLRERKSAG
ncbi:hypothetical protein AURDEDRAFT_177139 [Auricularia subglabra TFB-10046 SS5]|uniref:Uncharacterized protein n=1 Tax=Auricularia subglabra (strain TFB-10046 / SS5) TaxID=717982 RepID=J0LBF4_AURST|nr:hypothetical protein AURDEDRAFT_177139 [Auricularia subglabra TFB-10046 SS5]